VEVSEAICEARPASGTGAPSGTEGQKGGSATRSPGTRRPRQGGWPLMRPRHWAAAMPACRRLSRCSAPGC
jgi:hypothetical protein